VVHNQKYNKDRNASTSEVSIKDAIIVRRAWLPAFGRSIEVPARALPSEVCFRGLAFSNITLILYNGAMPI